MYVLGTIRNVYTNLVRKSKKNSRDHGIDGRIILKQIRM
jgi:hypothetical protein